MSDASSSTGNIPPNSRRHTLNENDTEQINYPIEFVSGQFAGLTIRTHLEEIQKANLGRKYARVDRRPLDPPPVVLLRLYRVLNANTPYETEAEIDNYGEIQLHGLICTVDLFQAPNPTSRSSTLTQSDGSSDKHRPEALFYQENFPIIRDAKMTNYLAGSTYVQPVRVDLDGGKKLLFVFSDLSVQLEGWFRLRYRAFDLFSRVKDQPDTVKMQAETYGKSFKVYSTKEFPGLLPSTELTKQISRYGVRLNVRETERKRKRRRLSDDSIDNAAFLEVLDIAAKRRRSYVPY